MKSILARVLALIGKELLQMRRDRLTFAMLLGIPLVQLVLFGYAINMQPKNLPTALYIETPSEISRSIVATMAQSGYFDIVAKSDDSRETAALLQSGKVNFVLNIPQNFDQALLSGEAPQLLLETDATDPAAGSAASASFAYIVAKAIAATSAGQRLAGAQNAVDVVVHNAFNPQGLTYYNIVPGLLGIILTMTGVLITAISMTRERERGTMENLLAMPVRPFEVMLGKITPYIGMGVVQSLLILLLGKWLFHVPFVGDALILAVGLMMFLFASLTLGFTFSTIAKSQLQAMQMTIFFFLPSILLSGFMFPFRGMPSWAQAVGEILPLTHFLRIVRGVMLKDASFAMLQGEFIALGLFWLGAAVIAMRRYRLTLG